MSGSAVETEALPRTIGVRIIMYAMITAMNERPLRAKHAEAPHAVSTRPPMTGPMTRARLNCTEFMAMAFGTSSRLTSSGSSDA